MTYRYTNCITQRNAHRPLHRTQYRSLLLILVALAGVGCRHSAFDQRLRAGNWVEAAEIFRRDSALQLDLNALRKAARLHATPDSTTWDANRALALFDAARDRSADGTLPDDDVRLETLLRHLVRERAEWQLRIGALSDSIQSLERETERLRAEIVELRENAAAHREEHALLQRLITRFEGDLRDRELQIAALRMELDRLKAIDLTRPSDPRPH